MSSAGLSPMVPVVSMSHGSGNTSADERERGARRCVIEQEEVIDGMASAKNAHWSTVVNVTSVVKPV